MTVDSYRKLRERIGSTELTYFLHTNDTFSGKILIVAGMHGDEASVIPVLTDFLESHQSILPSYIYIPEMSPEALQLQTRHNSSGADKNRVFTSSLEDAEAIVAAKIITDHAPYDVVVSVHEDVEYQDGYVYEVGTESTDDQINAWRAVMREKSIGLFNGVDDPYDSSLQHHFIDGYNHTEMAKENGQLEYWVLLQHYTKRSLTVEVPSSLENEKKRLMIESLFQCLVLPSFAESSVV